MTDDGYRNLAAAILLMALSDATSRRVRPESSGEGKNALPTTRERDEAREWLLRPNPWRVALQDMVLIDDAGARNAIRSKIALAKTS